MNGEVLAPEKDELAEIFGLPEGDDGRLDGVIDGTQRRKGGLKRKSAFDSAEVQDPVEYALSQEVLVGEVGERDMADGDMGDGDAMDVDGEEMEMTAGLSSRDKAARKEEKKRRKKAEQKEREQQRAGNKG